MNPTVTLINDAEWRAAPAPAAADTESRASFGSLETARGHLPLEAMDVRARIAGLSYKLVLRQTFVNNLGSPLEATYIFPLPPRAAVTEFRLRVGDREVIGEISERGQARAAYNQAIASGHRAAIAEEDRSGVFNMRVGNLMPGDRAEVELVLTGPIELDGATATFRFPLVVAPRYIPGRPLAGAGVGAGTSSDTDVVPDASRISPPVLLPGYPNPVRLAIRVELEPAGLRLDNLRCALHAVVAERRGSTQVIELRPGERLDRDFVLRFDIAADELSTSLTASPDADGEGGTFCLVAVPPRGAISQSKPRDVVFVLDRSGSMSGWKMIAARRAVARMIDSLGSADRFSIMAFDNVIETAPGLGSVLIEASDRNRFRAIEFLAGLEARGGTEMYQPLFSAAALLGSGYRDRERVLVLVTDGQVGNEDQILRDMSGALGARLFAVGVDRAVNEGFLRRLAALGAGSCSLVESEDRLDEAMEELARRIGEPVITEISLAGTGFDIEPGSTVPARLPDLFASTPTVIRGRYRGKVGGRLTLSGTDIAGAGYQRDLEPRLVASDAAASIWARGQIRRLEDEYAIGTHRKDELGAEIIALSLRHKVLSRFTAFVAVDSAVVANPGGRQVEVVQPVDLPEGWEGKRKREMSPSIASVADSFFESEAGAGAAECRHDRSAAVSSSRGEIMPMSATESVPPSTPLGPPPPLAAASTPKLAFPSPSASPGPEISKQRERTQTHTGIIGRPRQFLGADAPGSSAGLSSAPLLARLEQVIDRHDRRTWLDGALRLARLLIELDELLADLRSFGSSPAWLDAVGKARETIASTRDADIDAVLRALIAELGNAAGPTQAGRPADAPFWR